MVPSSVLKYPLQRLEILHSFTGCCGSQLRCASRYSTHDVPTVHARKELCHRHIVAYARASSHPEREEFSISFRRCQSPVTSSKPARRHWSARRDHSLDYGSPNGQYQRSLLDERRNHVATYQPKLWSMTLLNEGKVNRGRVSIAWPLVVMEFMLLEYPMRFLASRDPRGLWTKRMAQAKPRCSTSVNVSASELEMIPGAHCQYPIACGILEPIASRRAASERIDCFRSTSRRIRRNSHHRQLQASIWILRGSTCIICLLQCARRTGRRQSQWKSDDDLCSSIPCAERRCGDPVAAHISSSGLNSEDRTCPSVASL